MSIALQRAWEDIHFPNGAAAPVNGTTGWYRPDFARCGLGLTGGQMCKGMTFPAGSVTSFWHSRQFIGALGKGILMGGLGKSGAYSGLFVGSSFAADGRIAIMKWVQVLNEPHTVPNIGDNLNQIYIPIPAGASWFFYGGPTPSRSGGGSEGDLGVAGYTAVIPGLGGRPGPGEYCENVNGVTPAQYYAFGNVSIGNAVLISYMYQQELASESGSRNTFDTLHKVDMQLTGPLATATVNVYWDKKLIVTWSGDLSDIAPGVDQIWFFQGFGGGGFQCQSEFIVNSAAKTTLPLSLCTLAPVAPGAADEWSGDVSKINEIILDTTTYVSTGVSGQTEQFTVNPLPAGIWQVDDVTVSDLEAITAGAGNGSIGVRTGGVTSAGPGVARTVTPTAYERIMELNPVTGLAWTQAQINEPLQTSISSSSLSGGAELRDYKIVSAAVIEPDAPIIGCGNPPAATVGIPYSHAFPVTGGAVPLGFSLVSGSLPPGLILNSSTGVVSGTPTSAGYYPFAIRVIDVASDFSTVTCAIVVNPGAGFGNVYTLDPAKFTDDDYGPIDWHYVTYGFPDRDTEQQLQLGGGLKMNTYHQTFIAGTGYLIWKALVNSLSRPWKLVGRILMNEDPEANLEWGGGQATGQRFFYRFSGEANPKGSTVKPATDKHFSLSALIVGLKPNARQKVRGSNRPQ